MNRSYSLVGKIKVAASKEVAAAIFFMVPLLLPMVVAPRCSVQKLTRLLWVWAWLVHETRHESVHQNRWAVEEECSLYVVPTSPPYPKRGTKLTPISWHHTWAYEIYSGIIWLTGPKPFNFQHILQAPWLQSSKGYVVVCMCVGIQYVYAIQVCCCICIRLSQVMEPRVPAKRCYHRTLAYFLFHVNNTNFIELCYWLYIITSPQKNLYNS